MSGLFSFHVHAPGTSLPLSYPGLKLKTIACLWIFLCVTENIHFIMVVYTFCGRIWVRKELIESCSLTACFIKVEILLILLENPNLFWMWKFTVWKLNNLLTFLWWMKAPAPTCTSIQLCEAAQPQLLFLNQYTLPLHIYFGFKDPILLSSWRLSCLKKLQSWQIFYE